MRQRLPGERLEERPVVVQLARQHRGTVISSGVSMGMQLQIDPRLHQAMQIIAPPPA